ncbi:MAG: hypothetical protein M1831_002408 [Alyxoria varia]|nr:MAG: hypothetical protein M1831_002408 [Alyxoria varia]
MQLDMGSFKPQDTLNRQPGTLKRASQASARNEASRRPNADRPHPTNSSSANSTPRRRGHMQKSSDRQRHANSSPLGGSEQAQRSVWEGEKDWTDAAGYRQQKRSGGLHHAVSETGFVQLMKSHNDNILDPGKSRKEFDQSQQRALQPTNRMKNSKPTHSTQQKTKGNVLSNGFPDEEKDKVMPRSADAFVPVERLEHHEPNDVNEQAGDKISGDRRRDGEGHKSNTLEQAPREERLANKFKRQGHEEDDEDELQQPSPSDSAPLGVHGQSTRLGPSTKSSPADGIQMRSHTPSDAGDLPKSDIQATTFTSGSSHSRSQKRTNKSSKRSGPPVFDLQSILFRAESSNMKFSAPEHHIRLAIDLESRNIVVHVDHNPKQTVIARTDIFNVTACEVEKKIHISGRGREGQSDTYAHLVFLDRSKCKDFGDQLEDSVTGVRIRKKDPSTLLRILENAQRDKTAGAHPRGSTQPHQDALKVSSFEVEQAGMEKSLKMRRDKFDQECERPKETVVSRMKPPADEENRPVQRHVFKKPPTADSQKTKEREMKQPRMASNTKIGEIQEHPKKQARLASSPVQQEPRTVNRVTRQQSSPTAKTSGEVRDEVQKYSKVHGLGPRWQKPLVFPKTGRSKATVDFEDLKRLDDEEFLNDNIISFCLRYAQVKSSANSSRVYFFNSFFYDTITKRVEGKKGINYEGVRKWTSKIKLLEDYDYVVVPINENIHWYVAIICNIDKLKRRCDENSTEDGPSYFRGNIYETSHTNKLETTPTEEDREITGADVHTPTKTGSDSVQPGTFKKDGNRKGRQRNPDEPMIITLDSFGQEHSTVVRNLKDYLRAEALDKHSVDIEEPGGHRGKNIPMQDNLYDCGIFMVGYVAKFLENPHNFIIKLVANGFDETHDWPNLIPSVMRDNCRRVIMREHDTPSSEQVTDTETNVSAYQEFTTSLKRDSVSEKPQASRITPKTNDGTATSSAQLSGTAPVIALDDARDLNDKAVQERPSPNSSKKRSGQVELTPLERPQLELGEEIKAVKMQPPPQRVEVIVPEEKHSEEVQVPRSPQATRVENLVPQEKRNEEVREVQMMTPFQSSPQKTAHDILEEVDSNDGEEDVTEVKIHISPQSMQQQNATPIEVDDDEEMLDEFHDSDPRSPYSNLHTLGPVERPSWLEQLQENAGPGQDDDHGEETNRFYDAREIRETPDSDAEV